MNKKDSKQIRSRKTKKITTYEGKTLEEMEASLEKLECYVEIKPQPMWSGFGKNPKSIKLFDLQCSKWSKALQDEKKRETIINRVFSEIIIGAYQDRVVAYAICPSGYNENSTEAMEMIQRIRHKADLHLIRVMQAFNEIKRPPVKVVVKQADQVNVGEKQMNVDKQLNVSTDLDKK